MGRAVKTPRTQGADAHSASSGVPLHERGVFRDCDDPHVLRVYDRLGRRLALVELAECVDEDRAIEGLWAFLDREDVPLRLVRCGPATHAGSVGR